jgi:hypothetical protein
LVPAVLISTSPPAARFVNRAMMLSVAAGEAGLLFLEGSFVFGRFGGP